MELKPFLAIEIYKKIDDKEYKFTFHMPVGCPIGIAYDAAFDTLQNIITLAKEAGDKMVPANGDKISEN